MQCTKCGHKSTLFDFASCPKCGYVSSALSAAPNIATEPAVTNLAIPIRGTFRKARVKALGNRYGRYRGPGTLTIHDAGIGIEGRHVMSVGAQWGIGLLLFIGFALVTAGWGFVIGWLPIYLIMGHVILKRENLTISTAQIRKYAFDPEHRLFALEFEGPPRTSPVVMAMFTSDLSRLAKALRVSAPDRDAAPHIQVE